MGPVEEKGTCGNEHERGNGDVFPHGKKSCKLYVFISTPDFVLLQPKNALKTYFFLLISKIFSIITAMPIPMRLPPHPLLPDSAYFVPSFAPHHPRHIHPLRSTTSPIPPVHPCRPPPLPLRTSYFLLPRASAKSLTGGQPAPNDCTTQAPLPGSATSYLVLPISLPAHRVKVGGQYFSKCDVG